MSGAWTAASVRAAALARQRVGAGLCRTLAAQTSLNDALALLRPSAYARFLETTTTLDDAAHGTRVAVLWQLRVLAGWFPPFGGRLARALAAGFERDNIVGLAARLAGRPAPPAFELGTLATAWPRLRRAGSMSELEKELARTLWASPSEDMPLRDRLTLAWLRRLDAATPAVRRWHEAVLVLLIAKNRLIDETPPPPALKEEAVRLVGSSWERTRNLEELRAALPSVPGRLLADVDAPEELWRAEKALRLKVEDDAFAWIRSPRPGSQVILGSVAVLASDAWRIRAALASAARGGEAAEGLDVVA